MKKILNLFVVATLFLFFTFSARAASEQIQFGIDCMVHDSKGAMLSDLGMLGATKGTYISKGSFGYQDYKIVADLDGPNPQIPDMPMPQFKVTITDSKGVVVATLLSAATPEMSVGLWIPRANVYVHCDKMDM